MSQEVPVHRTDVLVLVIVSLVGGFAIASWMLSPEISPQYFNAVFVATIMLAFFLFIPVMGARLFIDDWKENR
ncbi:hypothetical protein ACLI4Z_14120 [Natrialbaceae archaeon A-arb3/5]